MVNAGGTLVLGAFEDGGGGGREGALCRVEGATAVSRTFCFGRAATMVLAPKPRRCDPSSSQAVELRRTDGDEIYNYRL